MLHLAAIDDKADNMPKINNKIRDKTKIDKIYKKILKNLIEKKSYASL